MQQIGVIMSYDSHEEYRAHRNKMIELGYLCIDWIPEDMHVSYLKSIRYTLDSKS